MCHLPLDWSRGAERKREKAVVPNAASYHPKLHALLADPCRELEVDILAMQSFPEHASYASNRRRERDIWKPK